MKKYYSLYTWLGNGDNEGGVITFQFGDHVFREEFATATEGIAFYETIESVYNTGFTDGKEAVKQAITEAFTRVG